MINRRIPFGGEYKITSPYGERVLNDEVQNHKGIDLVGVDDVNVYACLGGEVVTSAIITDKSNLTWQWGNYVCIKAEDGTYHYYCHLKSRKVKKGDRVSAGDEIGVMGNTGYSLGAHLHFEVRENDRKTPINTAEYLGVENKIGAYNNVIQKLTYDVNEWSKYAFEWAVKNEIIKGVIKDNSIDYLLDKNCTREEIVVFLYRFCEMIERRFENDEGND